MKNKIEMEKEQEGNVEAAKKAIFDKNWPVLEKIEKKDRDSFIHAVFEWAGLKDLWFLKELDKFNTNEVHIFATSGFPLLIIGQTGTSKELMARAIQMMGDRRSRPYKIVDCSTIAPTLLDSELFGHEKGAFTGAIGSRKGIFEEAHKGTVFLDELGKMGRRLQPQLLRVIEYGEYRPVGSNQTKNVDVHVIAAIQPKEIKNIIPDLRSRFPNYIEMPPLRERLEKAGNGASRIVQDSLVMVLNKTRDPGLQNISLPQNWLSPITSETFMELLPRDFESNYRELENILMKALVSTKNSGEKIISPRNLRKAIARYEKFQKYTEKELKEDSMEPKKIKLKDLFKHADNERASIIETIIRSKMESSGMNLKSLCEKEGIEYHNFRKKVVAITGKGIKEFGS